MVLFESATAETFAVGVWWKSAPAVKPQPMTDELMTVVQAATLKQLAQDAYELDAFKPNLTRQEADKRIAMLTAKLKLLDGPPHTL
jgi:glyoxylate carboligase